MLAIFNSLFPVFLLITLGFGLKRTEFLSAPFWQGLEKLTYWILLPGLFFQNLATAKVGDLPFARIVGVATLALTALALLLWLVRPLFGWSGPAFTSVLQGGIRFNSFVGLAVMLQLFGAPGLLLTTVIVAVSVPLVNVYCILALARYGHGTSSAAGIARSIATNPLIIGCVAGVLFNLTGWTLPAALETTLKAGSQTALVTGILTVGASLEFRDAHAQTGPVLFACIAKFILLPLITAGFCVLFDVHGATAAGIIFFAALPTATSSYILARQLGGDAALMSSIVTAETVLAFLALPAVVALTKGI